MRQIVARATFGLGKGQFRLSFNEGGKERFFLSFGPTTRDKLPPEPNRCQIRLDNKSFTNRFHHWHHIDRIAAEAAILMGERQASNPISANVDQT